MNDHAHYIKKCKKCGSTITQCRCASNNKIVISNELCLKCIAVISNEEQKAPQSNSHNKNKKVKYLNKKTMTYGEGTGNINELIFGEEYELIDKEVKNWYTLYHLSGINGTFNSVLFENISDEEQEKTTN